MDRFSDILHTGGTFTNRNRVLRRSSGFDPDKFAKATPTDTTSKKKRFQTNDESIEEEEKQKAQKQPLVPIPDLMIILDYPNNKWAIRGIIYLLF